LFAIINRKLKESAMTIDLIIFLTLAVVAVASALGMLLSESAVYSALYLVLNFSTVAIFYLLLGAPFIAISQVTVYAGAIMVLFLFVIMLLGAERLAPSKVLPWQRPLAVVLAVVLIVEAAYLFIGRSAAVGAISAPDISFNSMDSLRLLGMALFTQYLLPFEATSILLLVAMVGAIVLTKPASGGRK
jgi:NADH-quinone oxidoreductase subunit J